MTAQRTAAAEGTADWNRLWSSMHDALCAECGHYGSDLADAGCVCCQRARVLVTETFPDTKLSDLMVHVPAAGVATAERIARSRAKDDRWTVIDITKLIKQPDGSWMITLRVTR